MIGLHCCLGLSLVSASEGYFLFAVRGLLLAMTSLVSEHELQSVWAEAVACGLGSCGSWALEHRLNSCGAQAQLLLSMWDLSRSGIEPMSPALAGGFFTTESPGKPQNNLFISICTCLL